MAGRSARARRGTFAALGIPTVRDEEWRFTNAAPLGAIEFLPAEPMSGAADRLHGFAYTDAPLRLVIVNGRFDTTLSRTKGLPAGVQVGLAGGGAQGPPRRRPALLRPARRLQQRAASPR